jgi:transglutaminase-like putative cysteine protease
MNLPVERRILAVLSYIFIADWQHKLRLVLTGIIIMQFVEWFDTYWLADTEWLVRAVLAVTLLTEYFSKISATLRRIAALIIITVIHFGRLDIRVNGYDSQFSLLENISAVMVSIGDALSATTPFIWFSLGTYVVYLVSVYWLKERARIIIYILLSVILFALVDSYSKLIMWDQTAYIIFCGLGLIIIEHYEHFRVKHPASWSYLSEYPGKVAVPIVIIISVVMAAGLLAPNARPLLQDPYTIYKHWKGEKVITGGKGFPNANPTILSTLNASSGYGREDGDLGGGFDFDYAEVMRITTTHRSYWRGETKSLYTGSGWIPHDSDLNAPVEPVATSTPLAEYDWGMPSATGTVEVQQQVIMSEEEPEYPVLFGAFPIQSLQIDADMMTVSEAGEVVVVPAPSVALDSQWSAKQGEVRWLDKESYPRSYHLKSAMPVTNVEAWRAVQTADYSDEQWAPYLQLPNTVTQRVRELAKEIIEGAGTPYDQVKAIEAYLQENYAYTNKPDVTKGKSEDFVDRFLFEIQEGYCDYYSTAMAVMVRSIGLPTRWVKGFKSGSAELEEMYMGMGGILPPEVLAELESGEGTYIVRNADAHSWVEVFFPGYGWLPFEPTSGMVMPVVIGPDEVLPVTAPIFDDAGIAESDEASLFTWVSSPVIVLTLILLVALGLMLVIVRLGWLYQFRASFIKLLGRRSSQQSLNQQALQEIGRIFKLFRRKGYVREHHETVRESFANWTQRNAWLKKDLDLLLSLQEKAKYSAASITSEDLHALFSAKKRLKEEM